MCRVGEIKGGVGSSICDIRNGYLGKQADSGGMIAGVVRGGGGGGRRGVFDP